MKRQSLSRICKNPLGRRNRTQESDSSDSSSSKQIGESSSSIESANISAPLNHDALRDKENETARFRMLNITSESNNPFASLSQSVKDSKDSLENTELVQIYNRSKSFTRREWKRIEKIENETDISGRICIPCVNIPPSLTEIPLRGRDCIRPRAFSYKERQDYNELVFAAQHQQEHNQRERIPSNIPTTIPEVGQDHDNMSSLTSSLRSAFHAQRR